MEKEATNYSEEFRNVIDLSKNKGFYIGTGNPSSNLLIIGKEASIDTSKFEEQHQIEFVNNAADWGENALKKVQFSDIGIHSESQYNPIYPYKGQKNIIENKKTGRNGGTSRTWLFYQRLIDEIFNNGFKSEMINFHEKSFITELNQITGPYSHTIPRQVREQSINKRLGLLQQDFFQKFPIVIVAVGHYVRDFNVDLPNTFNVKFTEPTIDLGQNNWINVHHEKPNNAPKLLIHTNQLSMIKSDLIVELAKICREWIIKNPNIFK